MICFWQFKRAPLACAEPLSFGTVELGDVGLYVTAEDGYYSGTIGVEESVEMAVEVLRKFRPDLLVGGSR